MTKEEKELLLKGLRWTDMETLECHCYNCELFDSKNNTCKCLDLCKRPTSTFEGFYTKDRNNKVITLKEKQLVFQDICARLPWGVKVQYNNKAYTIDYVSAEYEEVKLNISDNYTVGISEVKPYLRPMESMTNKESADLYNIYITSKSDSEYIANCTDYLLSRYLDYRGLIPMGLALEAPEGMYNIK